MADPLIYARFVHFAATILVAGVALFLALVVEPAFARAGDAGRIAPALRARLACLGLSGLALSLLSGAAWLVVTGASMSGEPPSEMLDSGVLWTVLAQTTFGNDWLLRLVLAALIAVAFIRLRVGPSKDSTAMNMAAALLAAVFVGSLAWAGHGAGGLGSEAIIHPAADALHLIAAAAWLGALVPLALLLHVASQETGALAAARAATLRFSTLGVVSVGTLLVTGIVNSWYLVGNISALTGTDYGRLLMAKIALFFVMVAVAAVNRLYLTPRLVQNTDPADALRAVRRLRRNTGIEAFAGIGILAVVAMLGTLPPASHAGHHPVYGAVPEDAAYVHIHSDRGMADVTIEPGMPGNAHAIIRLWTEDFAPLNARQVTLTLTPPAAGSQPETRSAVPAPDGAWRVDDIALSEAGNWRVVVKALLADGKELVLDAPIVIAPR